MPEQKSTEAIVGTFDKFLTTKIGKSDSKNDKPKEKQKTDEEIREEAEKEAAKQRAKYFEGINLEEAYLGQDFKLSEYLTIHLPTVKEIIDYGPSKFWSFLTTFCANPTAMRTMLWQQEMEWFRMSDFDLFRFLLPTFSPDLTGIFFKDFDFRLFKEIRIPKTEEELEADKKSTKKPKPLPYYPVLVMEDNPNIYMDEEMYMKMVNYLRAVFDYHPKVELPRTKLAIKMMLEADEIEMKRQQRESALHPTSASYLLPLLSFFFSMYPNYNPDNMNHVNYFFFMDAIRRAQEVMNTEALMHGMYGGFLDLSNNKNKKLKKDLNLLKPLY